MTRPLIGITVDYSDTPDHYESPMAYATAVEKGGGLPVLLPYRTDLSLIPQFVDRLQGVLLSGGNDLDPSLYGKGPYHPRAEPIAEVERRRMPVLGICLGSQVMNVYRGGSLHQFIPDLHLTPEIEHRRLKETPAAPRHAVNLINDTAVAHLLGKNEIDANSSHKQSVDRPGRGLRIIGTSPDGVIEGIEDPTFPLFLGVQWHPERLHQEKDHLALFKLLAEKSAEASGLSGK
jgi:putative glutamine amidotransferase